MPPPTTTPIWETTAPLSIPGRSPRPLSMPETSERGLSETFPGGRTSLSHPDTRVIWRRVAECHAGQLELTRISLSTLRLATHIFLHCWAGSCPGTLKGTGEGGRGAGRTPCPTAGRSDLALVEPKLPVLLAEVPRGWWWALGRVWLVVTVLAVPGGGSVWGPRCASPAALLGGLHCHCFQLKQAQRGREARPRINS